MQKDPVIGMYRDWYRSFISKTKDSKYKRVEGPSPMLSAGQVMTEAPIEFFSSVLQAFWLYSGCLINPDFGNATMFHLLMSFVSSWTFQIRGS